MIKKITLYIAILLLICFAISVFMSIFFQAYFVSFLDLLLKLLSFLNISYVPFLMFVGIIYDEEIPNLLDLIQQMSIFSFVLLMLYICIITYAYYRFWRIKWLKPLLLIASIFLLYNFDKTLEDFSSIGGNIEYTRFVKGKTWGLQLDDSTYYEEKVLIKNMPRNAFEQSKIMVNYFDSVGLSINDLKMQDIKTYRMTFYKYNSTTLHYFTENGFVDGFYYISKFSYSGTSAHTKTYLGEVHQFRCNHDTAKWVISLDRKIGVNMDGSIEAEYATLLNESDSECLWYIKDINEKLEKKLSKYYTELRNKKNVKR